MYTSSDVMNEVALIFNITTEDIKAKNRHDALVFPRKICIYVCCNFLNISGHGLSKKLNRDIGYCCKLLKMIGRHIRNNESKWFEYWNKYERESTIWKKLFNKAA